MEAFTGVTLSHDFWSRELATPRRELLRDDDREMPSPLWRVDDTRLPEDKCPDIKLRVETVVLDGSPVMCED